MTLGAKHEHECPKCSNKIVVPTPMVFDWIEGARLDSVLYRLLCDNCASLLDVTMTPTTRESEVTP